LTALRCALGRPEVSVRCLRDGQEEFFSPGDGRIDSCVYALLGRDAAAKLLQCSGENGGVKVSGYASSPSAGRGNRREQYFYCNGRFIKSALLQAALEQAYKNSLLVGRYPACVLYLDMSCAAVDVNVHPAKTEVKFSDEKTVFDAVYYAVLSALSGEGRSASVEPTAGTRQMAEPKKDFYRTMSAADFRAGGYAAKPAAPAPRSAAPISGWPQPRGLREGGTEAQLRLDLPVRRAEPEKTPETRENTGFSAPAESKNVENPVQNVEKLSTPDHKIVGEAMKTYILVELEDELLLIDKHAAHERMNFDRLRAQERHIMAQSLLAPVTLRPSAEDAELIEQNGELLAELGFEIEPYGERDYIVRAVPAELDAGEIGPALEEICEKLRRGKSLGEQQVWDEILHTVACKAAIKAGWDTTEAELERIVEEVLSGRVKYCPHGRPVSVSLSRKDLDKMFKRIV
ncbi:MAG: DNA mismatch repair endonuclease MutL, partial [Clostridia bacterium]